MFQIKVLDKYLISKYLSTFFFAVLIFAMITVPIDFSDKVQSFIEKPCTKLDILKYYAGFILWMTGLLVPLCTLIGVVFFTSRMAFNSEILSILNAGVSFNRMLRPYLLAGCVVVVLHLLMNHVFIPEMNKVRHWFERTYVWTDQEKSLGSNVHFLVGPGEKVFIRGYNKTAKSASGMKLQKFEGRQILSILEAENASFIDSTGKWQLRNYTIRQFDGLKETFSRTVGTMDTAINLTPADFIFYANQNEEMTTTELREAVARNQLRGLSNSKSFEIELQRRTAEAFSNLILTVIGLAVAGRKVRGGMGLHLAIAIGIGALFILLSKFAVSFASSGVVSVAFGMWIPNLVFLVVAIWLAMRAQK